MDKIKLKYPLIVEGKCDKAFLSSFIDGVIIQVNGFQIFSDEKTKNLIKELSSNGVIVLTDSDSAGNIIRNHVKTLLSNKKIIHAYIPQITGKEKRKTKPSKEGYLGVEGMDKQIIIDALVSCGAVGGIKQYGSYTKSDLYELGFYGGENSKLCRQKLLKYLNLPDNISTAMLLNAINYSEKFFEFEKYLRSNKK